MSYEENKISDQIDGGLMDQYNKEVEAHNHFIERYRFYLDRIVNHLEWQGKRVNKAMWTPDEIRALMTSEIDMASSMDSPNKPGYYRANND